MAATPRRSRPVRPPTRRWSLPFLAAALAVATMILPAPAGAAPSSRPVTNWVRHHATPLDTVDPAAPLGDLRALRQPVGTADVVGLGEAVHGTSELLSLRHRALRFLVEDMGFRTVAWEEQWTTGVEIDEYIRTGDGNLDELVREMSPPWQWAEVRDVLAWLRSYNATHTDQVRFVGVEYYLTWLPAYDAVEAYVAGAAPERLPELLEHWALVEPDLSVVDEPMDHVAWYVAQPDKGLYVGAAQAAQALVDGIAHEPGDPAHDLALHNARQIVAFYEHFTLEPDQQLVYREARAAENLLWWHDRNPDQRIAYWAASAHTANAPDLGLSTPEGTWRYPTVGSHLRQRLGADYVSVGFTFDRGTVEGEDGTIVLRPADDHWFERPLRDIEHDQFAVDLRRPAPVPVRAWLDGPLTTRGLAHAGPDASMDGGSLAEWFDVLVHRQEVSPARPLPGG